ncbi:hypothetical protein FIBSPDRAFT_380211 [Athelia psychrophila]|uniref:Uncharacterized protein n=1 Tax=Athelia psychrophila TaxID=1759441 RepID=A0A166P5I2_9AGAM|nr:hypothetical protein FIBSPDRAFT_380211 [Fibularhizoctonia sp. CBS 109695]
MIDLFTEVQSGRIEVDSDCSPQHQDPRSPSIGSPEKALPQPENQGAVRAAGRSGV